MYWSKTFCVGRAPYSPVRGNTLLPLRTMWLEYLVAAMTKGVPKACGVTVSVRVHAQTAFTK